MLRCIQSTHVWLCVLFVPAILRSIDLRALSRLCNSSFRGVQDSVPYITELPTVVSNTCRRLRLDIFGHCSNLPIAQNILHPKAIRFWISNFVGSSKLTVVPRIVRPWPSWSTSTEKPSSISVAPRLTCPVRFESLNIILERLNISLESLNISLESLNVCLENLNIRLESFISLESLDISLESSNISLDLIN